MRFLLFPFLLPLALIAQNVMDDFSDGDLLNPNWQGDLTDFTVEDDQLRLVAEGAGVSSLFIPAITSTTEEVSYEFLIRMDFAPSGSNFAEISMSGLGDNGLATYTLKIGGISGSDDAIVLSHTFGNNENEEVLRGAIGAVGSAPALARVRLSRSVAGIWSLATDYTGANNLTLEASGSDSQTSLVTLNDFRIRCVYSSTRSDLFFFDDINIGPTVADVDAPVITNARLAGDRRIILTTNETVMNDPATELTNYTLDIPSPALATVNISPGEIELVYDGPFPLGQTFELTINNLVDQFGNSGGPYTESFFIEATTEPRPGSLIITEFMADPTPEVGLPNAEYVEVHNRTDTTMIIDGLQMASGGSPVNVNVASIPARGYGIIVAASNADAFVGLTSAQLLIIPGSMPSLTNGGDVITLSYNGQLLQELVYTDDWYDDPNRAGGGYSLELTDLNAEALDCQGLWAASRSTSGGTPAAENSVQGLVLDNEGPVLLNGSFVPGGVELVFDEGLAENIDLGAFSIEPDLGIVGLIELGNNRYLLNLSAVPQMSRIYEVSVSDEISDCVGNLSSSTSSIQLGIAEEVAVGDVVINEILFNPVTGGVDFVELFNCSEKILDIDGWTLANTLTTTGSMRERIDGVNLLLPGGYLAITPNVDNILLVYPEQAQAQFLVENRLPSLPNDEGNITVIAPNGDELDAFDYTEDLHSELLDDEDGVSLERVNPKSATQVDGNWFSAASRVGFATPTRVNSQRRDVIGTPDSDTFFFLDEDTVSPDGDGFQDALLLQYNTPSAGWNARIRIYDANGRLVKVLRRVELLAGAGIILWDGTNDDGDRVRTGVYVLLIERFEPDGSTATEKLAAVVVNPKG
ncbi:MAG: lamin tail domain-containing protein [Bacteroidota bacterium]